MKKSFNMGYRNEFLIFILKCMIRRICKLLYMSSSVNYGTRQFDFWTSLILSRLVKFDLRSSLQYLWTPQLDSRTSKGPRIIEDFHYYVRNPFYNYNFDLFPASYRRILNTTNVYLWLKMNAFLVALELRLASGQTFDFETRNFYNLTFTVDDTMASTTSILYINIQNANEPCYFDQSLYHVTTPEGSVSINFNRNSK